MFHECPRDGQPVVDPYKGLGGLLPKLAQPSWVWWIGKGRRSAALTATQSLNVSVAEKKARKKAAKRRYKAYRRLYDAIRGSA